MKPAPKLLSLPAPYAARRVLVGQLDLAAEARDRLADPQDAEALHDFRVSIRRLRTCLKAYRPWLAGLGVKKLRRRLGEVTLATNTGRDDQVHLLWLKNQLTRRRLSGRQRTGIRLMLDELEARRHIEQETIAPKTISDFAASEACLRKRLTSQPMRVDMQIDESELSFARGLGPLVQVASVDLGSGLDQIRSLDDAEPAHRARLAAKRLRYMIEPVRKELAGARLVIKKLKQLQDLLGELHDLHILETRVAVVAEHAVGQWSRQLIEAAAQRAASHTHRPTSQINACYALASVTRLVRRQQQLLFTQLQKRWLAGGADLFFGQVDRMIHRLMPADVPAKEPTASSPQTDPSAAPGMN